jgi:type I restriction enzyme S subunit
MLSVYREHGVILKDETTNPNKTAEDRSIYQLVDPGWFVVNRMKAWQGSVGISKIRGIVSGHYICFAPTHREDDRYLNWLMRSAPYSSHFSAISRGVRPGQIEIDNDELESTKVALPPLDEQRRIADFLDDQVVRIDNIIAARGEQIVRLDEAAAEAAFRVVAGSWNQPRRPSGLHWLGSIPADWPMATVHAGYSVMLGKMLDESRFTGRYAMPYLRNTNVQWDRITTDDLKLMDIEPGERERFTVRAGDLLICEGGQPGRSAVWDGSIAEIGYQKALHRARPRGGNDVRWLQAFLRVAVQQSVFSVEFGQATIGHLTGEQMRSLRLPMPAPEIQRTRTDDLQDELRRLDSGRRLLEQSISRLDELKRALTTAAVTGEFDVSSANGSRVLA